MVKNEHVHFDQQVDEISSENYQPTTPLEKKMAEALKVITTKKGRKKPKFARIQLQFPKAHEAFEKMKVVFKNSDTDEDGSLSLSEINGAVNALGGSATAEELKELFDTADTDESNSLDFKEFVVFLCVCSLLGKLDDECNLDSAFKCAVDAFSVFDFKNSGVIVFSEINHAMDDDAMASPDIMLARMQEMDKDGNRYVIFPEFLIAFMDWVGVDEDDDE